MLFVFQMINVDCTSDYLQKEHKLANGIVSHSKSRSKSEERPKAKKSLENKLVGKPANKKRSLSSEKSSKKKNGVLEKKAKKQLHLDSESVSSDLPLIKLSQKLSETSDDEDVSLAQLKKQPNKKKSKDKFDAGDNMPLSEVCDNMPLSELQNQKTPDSSDDDDDDMILFSLVKKKLSGAEKKEKSSGKRSKTSPSKIKVNKLSLLP